MGNVAYYAMPQGFARSPEGVRLGPLFRGLLSDCFDYANDYQTDGWLDLAALGTAAPLGAFAASTTHEQFVAALVQERLAELVGERIRLTRFLDVNKPAAERRELSLKRSRAADARHSKSTASADANALLTNGGGGYPNINVLDLRRGMETTTTTTICTASAEQVESILERIGVSEPSRLVNEFGLESIVGHLDALARSDRAGIDNLPGCLVSRLKQSPGRLTREGDAVLEDWKEILAASDNPYAEWNTPLQRKVAQLAKAGAL